MEVFACVVVLIGGFDEGGVEFAVELMFGDCYKIHSVQLRDYVM